MAKRSWKEPSDLEVEPILDNPNAKLKITLILICKFP